MAAQKIGFYSLRKTARLLCKFVFLFGPAIRKQYPSSPTLHAALTTAEAACHLLVSEIDLVAEPGV